MLTLMKKGVRGIHNVEVLKWCRYYEIYAGWNMLLAFPGEQLEDCLQQADWAKSLRHLQPPDGIGPIWLERFSPYFSQPGLYPVTDMKPEKSYYYVYPKDSVDVGKVAYFFDYNMGDVLTREEWEPLYQEIKSWQLCWKEIARAPELTYKKLFDEMIISDKRGEKPIYTIIPMLKRHCTCSAKRGSR